MLRYLENLRHALLLLLLQATSQLVLAQSGSPVIDNFPPLQYYSEHYVASPQNWGIQQDSTGLMFIANESGVLTFDGATWDMVQGTERLRLNKLALGTNGRVFSGGVNDLGYIAADSMGTARWVSLAHLVPDSAKEFKRIFNVVSVGDTIFFLSRTVLLAWHNQRFWIWKHSRFERIFPSPRGLLVIRNNAPPARLVNGRFQPLLSVDGADTLDIRGIVDQGTSGFLAFTYKQGIYRLLPDQVLPVNSALDSISIFNICVLPNGNIAAGTNGHGLYIFNAQGTVVHIIDEASGLQQNQVIWPYVDREHALWVGLFSGVSRIAYPARLSFFGKKEGLSGIPISMLQSSGNLYVGTMNGCYWTRADSTEASLPQLHKVNSIAESWQLFDVEGTVLVVATNGIFRIEEDGNATRIGPDGSFAAACRSSNDPRRIFVARGSSILSLYYRNDQLTLESEVVELPHSVFYMVQEPGGRLWASYFGLSAIEQPTSDNPLTITFDSLSGLRPDMELIEVANLNGQIVLGTSTGLYQYNEAEHRLEHCKRFGKQFSNGNNMAYTLAAMQNGDVWLTTRAGTCRLLHDENWRLDSFPLAATTFSEAWRIYEAPDGVVWIGTTEGLMRFDGSISKNYTLPYSVRLSKVVAGTDSMIFGGFGRTAIAEQPRYLTYNVNSIAFDFSATWYEARERLLYSYLLEGGSSKSWSPWTPATHKEYTDLWEGRYNLKVKARNAFGIESRVAEFRFEVLPPWYRSGWAYLLYVLSTTMLLWLTIAAYTRRLRQQKKQLEQTIAERTAEIATKASELERANTKLVELDKFKEGMTHMIAHDLKNPLNRILHANTTQDPVVELNQMKDAGRQMLNLVEDMLDVNKHEHTRMVLEVRPRLPSQLIDRALEQVHYLADKSSVELLVRAGSQRPVLADPVMMERVLVNLLTNAIKFGGPGSLVEISVTDQENMQRIAVADEGPGVLPDDANSVFEKFSQLDARTSGGVRSTGLGLAFCKLAVEAHDGHIGVENRPNKGAVFWCTLPVSEPEANTLPLTAGSIGSDRLLPELSAEDKTTLKPVTKMLRALPVYKSSAIRNTLSSIDYANNPAISIWAKAVIECSYHGDASRYRLLLDVVESD